MVKLTPTRGRRGQSRALLIAVCAVALLTLTPGRATAQDQSSSLQKVQGLNLPSSPGRFRTYYSLGYEKRAEEARRLLEEAARFYDSRLGFKVDLSIALLDQAAWRKVNGEGPYGIPFVSAAPHVVFLPASDDNVITRSQAASQDKLTPAVRQVMLKKGVLFIGLHELGHTYIEASGIHTGNKWFTEFLASYYALAFLSQKQPELAAVCEPRPLPLAGSHGRHTSRWRTSSDSITESGLIITAGIKPCFCSGRHRFTPRKG